jgi:hypothetical protein
MLWQTNLDTTAKHKISIADIPEKQIAIAREF